jgi:hypothetical protein
MTPINNYDTYVNGMKKSLNDKLFFLDKVSDIDTIMDYGCADGSLLKDIYIRDDHDYKLIGYDIDEEMIKKARDGTRVIFSSDYYDCLMRINPQKTLLNLSSVIHEVYSYAKSQYDIAIFWKRVFEIGYEYISIRDMCVSKSAERVSSVLDLKKIYKHPKLDSFYENSGSVLNNKNLIHFLMKYRYTENWEREVRENYLPITHEELMEKIPVNYEIVYHEHYILPFLQDKVGEDFGIKLKDNTHVKLLLKKR